MAKHKAEVSKHSFDFDVIIVGSGPGGYEGAIRAAQLGFKVCIIEKETTLGGVCLNWGCIPTKSLLKNAEVIHTIQEAEKFGVSMKDVQIDFGKIIERSRGVAGQMAKGVEFLMKKNKITVKKGFGRLTTKPNAVHVSSSSGSEDVTGLHIILATGTKAKSVPAIPVDRKRVITSYEALSLKDKPKSMVIIGAGAIGVEFAYFYQAVGTKVTIVEFMKNILPSEDEEVSLTLEKAFKARGIDVLTETKVDKVSGSEKEVEVSLTLSDEKTKKILADYVLVAIGLTGNIEGIGLEDAGVKTDKGFIVTDGLGQTNVKGVYAIGDVAGGMLLAHKASVEGIRCVERIAGLLVEPIDQTEVPVCTYCQPSVAHIGLTEKQAKGKGLDVKVGKFPFKASGKATASGHTDGFVKIVFDKKHGELLGAHIIGDGATEIIAELCVAKKMEATSEWIHNTIHAHPTISEGVKEAAANADGEAINL